MSQDDAKERIARCLRPELEKTGSLTAEEVNAVVGSFTVLGTSHRGHIQYRLTDVRPEIEQRSDVCEAISRAVQAAGYYVAGEE